ncbi:MAG: YggT family protein [bacterium]|nr:YggT family protein [bacterium]
MFVLGNFIVAIAQIISAILTILTWIIIIRALISWVNPDPYNSIVQFLYRVTEPILMPIRRILPAMGGFDLSPIVALIGIMFIRSFVVRTLIEFGMRIK